MKKIIVTLVIVFAIVEFSYAQTNTFPGTGSVGIGTTSPSDILEVAKSSTAKFKIFTPSGYTYPTDFSSGVIGLGLTRSDGLYTQGIFSYFSSGNGDNLAMGSRSDIVFLAGSNGLGGQPEVMRLKEGGNVGIGTTSPRGSLDVTNTSTTQNAFMYLSSSGAYGSTIKLGSVISNSQQESQVQYQNIFGIFDSNNPSQARIYINASGNVGIGTTTPRELLSINGNIRSKQVKVELNNWPDYVFKPTYNLRSLAQVKTYIDKNRHLPDMPSEKQIAEDGLNLGEIDKALAKKVEELTLYLIEQNKQIVKQQKINQSLQQQINKLKNNTN